MSPGRPCGNDWLGAECVGATSFGGDYDLTPEQDHALRELGWVPPEAHTPYPNYNGDRPREQSAQLADLAAATLVVLGLRPDALEWERERSR